MRLREFECLPEPHSEQRTEPGFGQNAPRPSLVAQASPLGQVSASAVLGVGHSAMPCGPGATCGLEELMGRHGIADGPAGPVFESRLCLLLAL